MASWDRAVSILAGGLLAGSGLARGPRGLPRALLGAALIERGVTGHSLFYEIFGFRTAPLGQGAATTSVPYELGLRVDRAITINLPRPEVFRFFRNLSNLSQFLSHVESVAETREGRSHWVVRAPAGHSFEWDAVLHNQRENELIAWRTLPGADVDHAGSVLFRDVPGGRGTEVRIELQYNPPAGAAGALISKLWGEEPTQQIDDDLRRLKQILEVGEVLTTEDQPRGAAAQGEAQSWIGRRKRPSTREAIVETASEASFPASDAPSYTR
ncbi:MAG TPA: SRPBCC family protein [Bryobacteraceae bacterium]